MPDFNGRWRVELPKFDTFFFQDRGDMDLTLEATGRITSAPQRFRLDNGTYVNLTVTGSILQVGPFWKLDLKTDDNRLTYKGLLIEDTASRMRFVAHKHVVQAKRGKQREEDKLFDQVDEPWVITKP